MKQKGYYCYHEKFVDFMNLHQELQDLVKIEGGRFVNKLICN